MRNGYWSGGCRRLFRTALFALSGTMLCVTAIAAQDDKEVILHALEAKYADVISMRASFTQTVQSELFGEETESGQVLIKRPRMMRWSFGDEKQFITDGDTMWIYTKSEKQVIRYDDIGGSSGAADSLLQSLDRIHEFFDVEVTTSDDTTKELILTPKNADDGQFKNVELTLNGQYDIRMVVITDQFDNVTRLAFAEVELNVDVADESFQFTPPEGVEVISATTN